MFFLKYEFSGKFRGNFHEISQKEHSSSHVAACHWLAVCDKAHFVFHSHSSFADGFAHMVMDDKTCHLVMGFQSPMGCMFFLFSPNFLILMMRYITIGSALRSSSPFERVVRTSLFRKIILD